MSDDNHAGNIIVNLASLPDFLRTPILKKRMIEFFSKEESDKKEIIYNALEAGPTIPFLNFSKLFKSWLKIIANLSEEHREGMFLAYIRQSLIDPEKLIAFNLDGILEMFLELEESDKETISNTIRKIIENLNDQDKKKILIIIPNNAKIHLKI
jgi:hypothetical protein